MQIISLRHGFDADHSSSTYEFFAPHSLKAAQKEAIGALTGKKASRTLRFHYWGEWDDIPAEWPTLLLTMGYEIMVSESYDWWSVQMSLPTPTPGDIERYMFDGDTGLSVEQVEGHLLLHFFGMMLDYEGCFDEFGEDLFEGLQELFQAIRQEILAGELSVLAMYKARFGRGVAPGKGKKAGRPSGLSGSARLLDQLLVDG